jgi:hypothetical protein
VAVVGQGYVGQQAVNDNHAFDYDAIIRHARYVLDTRDRMCGSAVEHR